MYAYEGWAEANLTVYSRMGAEWKVTCPNPNHEDVNPSCYFNVDKAVFHCFACGWGSSLKEGDFDAAAQTEVLRVRIRQMQDEDGEEGGNILSDSILNRYNIPHPFWPQERGLSQETIDQFNLGYDAIVDAATIPERNMDGGLLGVTRRFIHPLHKHSKYKYPYKFKAAENMFGSWIDCNWNTVCLVEGAIDAMKIVQAGMPALAIYGAQLSSHHVKILMELGVNKVIWFGDSDGEGVNAKRRARGFWQKGGGYTYKPETDLSKNFILMHVTDHQGEKDAGGMTSAQILDALDSVEPYYETMQVKQKRERIPTHIQLRAMQRRHGKI